MSNKNKIDIDRLKQLEPMSSLSVERLEELLPLAYVEFLDIGMCLFREGDIDNQTIYLLSGDVQLTSSDGQNDKAISYRSKEARFPLDDSQPRQVSATAITPVEVVRLDNSVLDYMMMWDQMAVSEAAEKKATQNEVPRPDTAQQEQPAQTGPQPQATQIGPQPQATQIGPQPQATQIGPQPQAQISVPETPSIETRVEANNAIDMNPHLGDTQIIYPDQQAARQPAARQPVATTTDPTIGEEEITESNPHLGDTQVIYPDALNNPQVKQPADDRSWVRKMQHIMAFKAMPPANLKQLLERMENVKVQQGENLIDQGESGEYYYVLTEGEAKVTRTIELATLKPGRSFGEEALLSGSSRNASVTMLSDGVVMRLSKDDFNELLKEPMLTRVAADEARLQVAQGARWLDVRHAKEYNHSHLPDALNIPLHELRLRLNELDKDVQYICYCGTGRRSSAATFLLVQNGFKVSVLNGGVRVMAQDLK